MVLAARKAGSCHDSEKHISGLRLWGYRVYGVNAVVAFATSPPLGRRRTEPEALKVRPGRRGPVRMHA